MKKLDSLSTVLRLSIFGLLLFVTPANAADANVGLDIATSYIFRGATLNDSFVAQPHFDLSGIPAVKGLSFGSWANFDIEDDDSGSPEGGHFSEIDLYASYALPLNSNDYGISVGYSEYTYPRSVSDEDREINSALTIQAVPLSPVLTVNYGVDGAIEEQVYIDLSLGHRFELSSDMSMSVGALAAYLVQAKDSAADDGFSYAEVDASVAFGPIVGKIAYYFETDEDVMEVETDLLGQIGISVDF